jgi:hypothetical protein
LQKRQVTSLSAKPTDFACLSGLQILGSGSETSRKTIQQLEAQAFAEYSKGLPRPDLLLGLTQLNFLRALYSNIDILGLSENEMHDDAISPFCTANSWHAEHSESTLPQCLKPTSIQRSEFHHPWIDLLPSSNMRDNLILAGDTFDDIELCHDLCGYRAASRNEKHGGVIVWKDPWDPTGWEVTETFMRKWGWVLRDCWDLFQSTNHWRAKRGERPLFPRIA